MTKGLYIRFKKYYFNFVNRETVEMIMDWELNLLKKTHTSAEIG
jgi:hypothetical protein